MKDEHDKIPFYKNKAIAIYETLSAEQLEFIAQKQVATRLKVKQWLDLLEKIAQMDALADQSRKKLIGMAIFSFVLAFISLFFIVVFFPVALFTLAAIGIGVRNITIHQKLRKIDLSNELRLFLMPFFVLMKDDLHPQKKITLKLNFLAATHQTKLLEQVPNSSKQYPKITTFFYEHPWIEAKAYLKDGSEINWQIKNKIRHRKIVKRSASGKIKHKQKYKVKQNINLCFKLDKTNYKLKTEQLNVPVQDTGLYYEFNINNKLLATSVENIPEIKHLFKMIAQIYNNVEPINKQP